MNDSEDARAVPGEVIEGGEGEGGNCNQAPADARVIGGGFARLNAEFAIDHRDGLEGRHNGWTPEGLVCFGEVARGADFKVCRDSGLRCLMLFADFSNSIREMLAESASEKRAPPSTTDGLSRHWTAQLRGAKQG